MSVKIKRSSCEAIMACRPGSIGQLWPGMPKRVTPGMFSVPDGDEGVQSMHLLALWTAPQWQGIATALTLSLVGSMYHPDGKPLCFQLCQCCPASGQIAGSLEVQ